MTTAPDVVNAAITALASAKTAYDDAVAELHAAQDLAGVPQTTSTFAELQALASQAVTLQQQNTALTAANAKLTANLANVVADLNKALADAAA